MKLLNLCAPACILASLTLLTQPGPDPSPSSAILSQHIPSHSPANAPGVSASNGRDLPLAVQPGKQPGVFNGRNKALSFTCTPSLMEVSTGPQSFSFELLSLRQGAATVRPQNTAQAEQAGKVLRYRHHGFTVEYVNSEKTLQQNFVITEKPGEGKMLNVALRCKGLKMSEVGRTGISLNDESGHRVLSYDRLKAWDAQGRILEAEMRCNAQNLILAVNCENATFPVTIDPTVGVWSYFNANNAAFPMASADIDADGDNDVIIGDYYESSNAGRLFVYVNNGGIPSSPTYTYTGYAGSELGISVANAGDINGDGFEDIVAGAWKYSNGITERGAVYVYHGSSSGLSYSTLLTTDTPYSNLGHSVAGLGDVNKDGFDDFAAGYSYLKRNYTNEGAAEIFLGSSGTIAGSSVTLWGGQASVFLGRDMAAAGDVNGDGYMDVVSSAAFYSSTYSAEGAVFIWAGKATSPSSPLPVDTIPWVFYGGSASAELGASVSGAGDLNNDGYDDVIAGAPGYNSSEGAVHIIYGSLIGPSSSTVADVVLKSGSAGSAFGADVAWAGDANGDDISDFIVGAPAWDTTGSPTDEGIVCLYYGSNSAFSASTTAIATAPSRLAGGVTNGRFGTAVAGIGDVNDDGADDRLVRYRSMNGCCWASNAELYNEQRNAATSDKGLFVDKFDAILGDADAETSLIAYAHNNGYSYLVLYDLPRILRKYDSSAIGAPALSCAYSDNARELQLQDFITDAHTPNGSGKKLKVAAIGETARFFRDIIQDYQSNVSDTNQRFDIMMTEYEFWNPSFNSGMSDCQKFDDFHGLLYYLKFSMTPNRPIYTYISQRTHAFDPCPPSALSCCTSSYRSTPTTIDKQLVYYTLLQYCDHILVTAYMSNPKALMYDDNDVYKGYRTALGVPENTLWEIAYHAEHTRLYVGYPSAPKVSLIFDADCNASGNWMGGSPTDSIDRAMIAFRQDFFRNKSKNYRRYLEETYGTGLINTLYTYHNYLDLRNPATFKYSSVLHPYCAPGKDEAVNLARDYDGAGDYYWVCDATDLSNTLAAGSAPAPFTIEAVIQLPSSFGGSTSTDMPILAGATTAGPSFSFGLDRVTNKLYFRSSALAAVCTSSVVTYGTIPHHVAVAYSPASGNISFYVDGVWKGSTGYSGLSGLIAQVSDVWIGKDPANTSDAFDGNIDEVRVWTVERTAQELADHMYLDLQPDVETDDYTNIRLLANWNFDEPTVQIARDKVSNTGNTNFKAPYDAFAGTSGTTDSHDPLVLTGLFPRQANLAHRFSQSGTGKQIYALSGVTSYLANNCTPSGNDFYTSNCTSGSARPADFTMEAWVNFDPQALKGHGGPVHFAIMSTYNTTSGNGFVMGLDNGGRIELILPGGRTYTSCSPTISMNDCEHVAVTIEPSGSQSSVSFYINGVFQCSTSVSGSTVTLAEMFPATSDSLLIGNSMYTSVNDVAFDGLIDEVRIWRKKNSGMSTNYNTKIEFGLGWLAACYRFDGKYGQTFANANSSSSAWFGTAVLGNSTGADAMDPEHTASCTPLNAELPLMQARPGDPFLHTEQLQPETQGTTTSATQDEMDTRMLSRSALLYPNPAHQYIVLPCEAGTAFEIYDMRGQLVLRGTAPIGSKADISGLPSGAAYFVRIAEPGSRGRAGCFIKE